MTTIVKIDAFRKHKYESLKKDCTRSNNNKGFLYAVSYEVIIESDSFTFWVTAVLDSNTPFEKLISNMNGQSPDMHDDDHFCKMPICPSDTTMGTPNGQHVIDLSFDDRPHIHRNEHDEVITDNNGLYSWHFAGFVRYRFTSESSIKTEDDFRFVQNTTYDGKDRGKYIPRLISNHLMEQYCRRPSEDDGFPNILNTESVCRRLHTINTELYNEILDDVCRGDNLISEKCHDYCSIKENNCDFRIQQFCESLGPTKALSETYSDVCGCFMGNTFYSNYFATIQKKFDFPVLTPPKHVCYFDYCASSNYKTFSEKQAPVKCPDIMMCFQNTDVTFDSGGHITTGDVNIHQREECSSIKIKCTTENDCPDSHMCSNKYCVERPLDEPVPLDDDISSKDSAPDEDSVPTEESEESDYHVCRGCRGGIGAGVHAGAGHLGSNQPAGAGHLGSNQPAGAGHLGSNQQAGNVSLEHISSIFTLPVIIIICTDVLIVILICFIFLMKRHRSRKREKKIIKDVNKNVDSIVWS